MGRAARRRGRKRALELAAKQNESPLPCWSIPRREASVEMIRFARWLAANGFHNETTLRVVHSEHSGRALFTGKCAIQADECVLTIPSKALITSSVLRETHPAIYSKFRKEMDCLMVFMMHHSAEPDSNWSAYLSMTPKDYSFLPCVWTEREVRSAFKKCTLPPSLLEGILSEGAKMVATYYRLKKLVVTHRHTLYYISTDLTNFDNFLWAYCSVNTRCVHLPVSTDKAQCSSRSSSSDSNDSVDKVVLVPFFDFFNHSPEADVRLEYSAEKGLKLFTNQAIGRYEQVYIKYHNYSNRQLFYNYGFTNIEAPRLDSDDMLCLHTSCQDLIPVTYVDLLEWLVYLEQQNPPHFRKVPLHSKRLVTLCEIDFISPKDHFDLVWPIIDYELLNCAVVMPDYRAFLTTTDTGEPKEADPDIMDVTTNGTLDWRLDMVMQLMARPRWDNSTNIRRLIYSDIGEPILDEASAEQETEYCRLWIHFLEWLLKRDYGIDVHKPLGSPSPTKQLAITVSHLKKRQVGLILANEIGLLLTIREKFHEKLFPPELSEDDDDGEEEEEVNENGNQADDDNHSLLTQ